MKPENKKRNILSRPEYWKGLFIALFSSTLFSCQKNWLDAKPTSSAIVLNTISDYQALMEGYTLYNTSIGQLGEIGTDNYFITPTWQANFADGNVANYIWAPTGFPTAVADWVYPYQNIYTCNSTIKGVGQITKTTSNSSQWDQVYGSALFYRGLNYYCLAQDFIKPYDSSTANTDPGVPLRLEANIAQQVGRGTGQEVYNQIISDLKQSIPLLFTGPQPYQQHYLPTKAAAFAQLARVYLSIRDYTNAKINADSALKYNHTLLNYNSIPSDGATNTKLTMPAYYNNPEVFFYCNINDPYLNPLRVSVDTVLYQSYADNDLRKKFFFNLIDYAPSTPIAFVGTYDGTSRSLLFSATAVDELFLIRAECEARQGDINSAMNDLNTLLAQRWKTGTFVSYTATDPTDALTKVLTERRKELVMRGVRWSDLRRLNKDPRFATTVTHIYNGQTYTLAPGSNLYVWPIPLSETQYSNITQNPR